MRDLIPDARYPQNQVITALTQNDGLGPDFPLCMGSEMGLELVNLSKGSIEQMVRI